jgi:anti-sigma B factor antagonist
MPRRSSPYRAFGISVVQNRDEVAVVVAGELDLASAPRLGMEVAEALKTSSTRVTLDLRQVDFIDSTGLRMLLSLRNDAKRNVRALTLVPPAPAARSPS